MRVFLSILILIFSLQSLTYAEDIRDFQIEGMSVGDSLLDYMSIKNINDNVIKNYFKDGKKRKYYAIVYSKISKYDQIEIYLETGDRNYEIKTISAFLDIPKKCKKKKNDIVEDLKVLFKNIQPTSYDDVPHTFDKTGESKTFQTAFLLKNDNNKDQIRVECTYWSDAIKKKHQFVNTLGVSVFSTETLQWALNGYK